MKPHHCQLKDLIVIQYSDGGFFAKSMHPFHTDWMHPVEYCPVCGEKSKVSHIDHLTKYPIDEIT